MPTEQPPSCPIRGGLSHPPFPLSLPSAKFSRRTGEPRRRRSPSCAAAMRRGFYAARSAADRPLFNGVVFTWSRAYRFPGRSRQIGFCALFPLASPPPALPRPYHPLASRAVLPSPSSRPVDGDIYGELYDSAFLFFTRTIRGAVLTGHGVKGRIRVASAGSCVFFSNLYTAEKYKRSIGLVSLSFSPHPPPSRFISRNVMDLQPTCANNNFGPRGSLCNPVC